MTLATSSNKANLHSDSFTETAIVILCSFSSVADLASPEHVSKEDAHAQLRRDIMIQDEMVKLHDSIVSSIQGDSCPGTQN